MNKFWNKTLVSLSLLLLSKFPLLCNYRVITGWKQIFIRHKFFMKLKIKSYILYYMLSIFIQCILHSLLLSLTLIFFHRKCGGRRSYCWSIRRIISSSTYSLVFFSKQSLQHMKKDSQKDYSILVNHPFLLAFSLFMSFMLS